MCLSEKKRNNHNSIILHRENGRTKLAMAVALTFVAFNALSIAVNIVDQLLSSHCTACLAIPLYVATLLICVNSATNFVIYCAMGADFRRRFIEILRLKWRRPTTPHAADVQNAVNAACKSVSNCGQHSAVLVVNDTGSCATAVPMVRMASCASIQLPLETNNNRMAHCFSDNRMSIRMGRDGSRKNEANTIRRTPTVEQQRMLPCSELNNKTLASLRRTRKSAGRATLTAEQRVNLAVFRSGRSVSVCGRPQKLDLRGDCDTPAQRRTTSRQEQLRTAAEQWTSDSSII